MLFRLIKKIARAILKEELDELNLKINKLNSKIEKKSEDEIYYNNKYPTLNVAYKRIDKLGSGAIDVRAFLQPYNHYYPTFKGKDDQIALNSLKWVIEKITYKTDKNLYKEREYWAFPHETLREKEGDCEDGALLLASIMLYNGIKPWKIRVTAGYVLAPGQSQQSGHAYVTYYCEETKSWVLLDWCYYPNTREIKYRTSYHEVEMYKDIWFSFNSEKSWGRGQDIRKAQKEINVI